MSTSNNTSAVDAAEQEGDFVISRTVNSPRAQVWKAWTDAAELAQWWGPKGCTVRVPRLELRPGGMFLYAMQYKTGAPEMWGRFVYREVVAPERLVYVSSFSNAAGEITRAPFPQLGDTWPLEVLNILTLAEQGDATALTLRGRPIGATEAELRTFAGMHDSMRQGFGGTFEVLEAHLQKKA